MPRVLDSFKVRLGNKVLDYRLGENLDLQKVEYFFKIKYEVKKLWQGPRHIHGLLVRRGVVYFLKLATSEGISIVTRNEYHWNNYFNKYASDKRFLVPKNYDSGLYKGKYYYLITDYFEGELICGSREYDNASDLLKNLSQIIELSEAIQRLPEVDFAEPKHEEINHQVRFFHKTYNWFNDIPQRVLKEFNVETLLKIVKSGATKLISKPRHGDFTPWHMILLSERRLGLIDGEHALSKSVEGYDICYLIQRIFSVVKNPDIAKNIMNSLKKQGYRVDKLKTVLAARAIGGFLDESLTEHPSYHYANSFKEWVEKLS